MTTTTFPEGLATGTWTVDPSHSEASFTVRHAGIAKVRGTVGITEGTVTIDESGGSVAVTLDPATVDTRDETRDNHLRSADFFEVETYPTWTFASTAVTGEGDERTIVGDLTIHGVTRQVEIAAEFNGTAVDPYGNERAAFSGTTEISRKDFDLTWNVALEAGGFMVSDSVKISLEVAVVRQK